MSLLYSPDNPRDLGLNRFWQRHYGSFLALVASAILAFTEARGGSARRRRQGSMLLGDDHVVTLPDARRMPSLDIDTAPRLWDRELDE